MNDLKWLADEDKIDPAMWVKLDDEIEGSTPDMCWVKNTANGARALFKPDNVIEKSEVAYREYVTSKIAKFLEIPCAKIEVGELFGKFGCLSYDCNTERRHRISDGDSLYRCDTLFNNKRSDTNNVVYDSPVELSFKVLCQYITKETESDLLKMMFLDCLVLNPDRHGGNYSFYINRQRAISGLMALYDHGLCMRSDLRDVSLFPYEGRLEMTFAELFKSISSDYPGFAVSMMEKVKSDGFKLLLTELNCYEFIQNRIDKFDTIMTESG